MSEKYQFSRKPDKDPICPNNEILNDHIEERNGMEEREAVDLKNREESCKEKFRQEKKFMIPFCWKQIT